MNQNVTEALKRLDEILPLRENQSALSQEDRDLHRKILHSYLDRSSPLTPEECVRYVKDIDDSLGALVDSKLIVVDEHRKITGCYPFSSEERKHMVHIGDNRVFCMCAIDSLAISPMFGVDTKVASTCLISGRNISFTQDGIKIPGQSFSDDLYVVINWKAADDSTCCVDSLCHEMSFVLGEQQAKKWNTEDLGGRQIFDLEEAIEFASAIFVPLMKDS